jgi:gliding motility-associated-like protein
VNTYIKKIVLLVLFAQSFIGISQQDTLFWFAAPDVSSAEGEMPIHLNLSSYVSSATVTIDQPANLGFTPIVVNLAANSNSVVDLTPFITDVESSGADIVDNSGIRITSSDYISASYEILHPSNRELFSLKGNKGIGMNFYTPFQKFWDNATVAPSSHSSFELVATEDGTTIAITPRTNIVGHLVGSTFTVNLNQGETYSARDINNTGVSSLAGSIVASNKPIAVTIFQGAVSNSTCTSTIGDQITPVDYLGENFIVNKTAGLDERFYILATENGTSITITNSSTTSALISWGETYEYVLADDINYIETNKPVYLMHVSGNGCNLGMTQVPHVYCAGKYEQSFSRESVDSFGLVINVRAGFEDQFTLNGSTTLVTAADFNVVPGTLGEYVSGVIYFNTTVLPIGGYNNLSNTGDIFNLATISGSSTTGTAYSFVSEFQSYPFINSGLDATVCANGEFDVTGLIGGGSVTGIWGSTGFGTWDKGLDTLINTYIPSDLDTIISPINLILITTGPCPVLKDTIVLTVTPAPIVSASVDQTVCANNANVNLDGSVTGGATTGAWITLGSGTFLPNNTDLSAVYIPSDADTSAGMVTLVLSSTTVGNCLVVTDTILISITNSPLVEIIEDTISVCANNTDVSLNGSVSGVTSTGKWITSGNGVFMPNNLSLNCVYQPSPQDVLAGNITIFLESTNNFNCFVEKDSVVVEFIDLSIVNAGDDQTICINSSEVDLSGAISGITTTGIWSGGNGTFSTIDTDLVTSYTPTASEISSGTLSLILTSTNNLSCLAITDNIVINFVAQPFANYSFTEACFGNITEFNDFSLNGFGTIVNWEWNFGDNSTASIENPEYTFSTPGFHNVELIVESDAGCYDTIVKEINVLELPVADYTYTSECNNDQVIISFNDASTVNNDVITNWNYDFGGQGNQSTQNPITVFSTEGNFSVTQIIETFNGCKDTIVKIINIPPLPLAGFTYDTDNGLNVGAEFSFIDTSLNSVSYEWDLGNGETSSEQNPATIYFGNGLYDVTQWVTSSAGCSDSITLVLNINTITTEISDLIPNAISPNSDGVNDVWKLEFVELLYDDANIVIVNRLGQTVFESIGYTTPWDGTINGDDVPEGTYYYVIKISEDEIYKGTILVLKNGK